MSATAGLPVFSVFKAARVGERWLSECSGRCVFVVRLSEVRLMTAVDRMTVDWTLCRPDQQLLRSIDSQWPHRACPIVGRQNNQPRTYTPRGQG